MNLFRFISRPAGHNALAWAVLVLLLWPNSTASLASDFVEQGPSVSTFAVVVAHYETARLALLEDRSDGVAEQGGAIATALRTLRADFSTEAAGVDVDQGDAARSLMDELIVAADALAAAEDLTASRDAFFALSKPLVRFRAIATGDRPIVGYCPMAKKSWLQPRGELGNPYHGLAMAECGVVVDEG